MTRAFVFPGQGSQAIGMGKELLAAFPVARENLEEIDDALGQNLTRLMAEGPAEELTLTENAQPALMAVSMAVLMLEPRAASTSLTPAHSLPAIRWANTRRWRRLGPSGWPMARLLKTRGQAMQKAVPVGEGGMAALLGAELDQAQEIADAAAEGQICAPPTTTPRDRWFYPAPWGNHCAIKIAGERGIRRSVKLPVSAPFHRAMMAPAAEVMEKALGKVAFVRPLVPVIATSPAATENPDDIGRCWSNR